MGDDLSAARTAVSVRDWPLAERLLERYLREAKDPDLRWEAWQQLMIVINSAGQEKRTTLEFLETMLAEFSDNDARSAVILRRMGEINESLSRHRRAAEAWNTYINLGSLSPQQTVEGYRHLAAMQFALRQFSAGEETLRQCIALPVADSGKIMCMYDLADQNMARERWQAVIDLCRQILESAPEASVRGLTGYLLADALEQTGKGVEALKIFEQARGEYPNSSVIDNRIAHLRKKLKK